VILYRFCANGDIEASFNMIAAVHSIVLVESSVKRRNKSNDKNIFNSYAHTFRYGNRTALGENGTWVWTLSLTVTPSSIPCACLPMIRFSYTSFWLETWIQFVQWYSVYKNQRLDIGEWDSCPTEQKSLNWIQEFVHCMKLS